MRSICVPSAGMQWPWTRAVGRCLLSDRSSAASPHLRVRVPAADHVAWPVDGHPHSRRRAHCHCHCPLRPPLSVSVRGRSPSSLLVCGGARCMRLTRCSWAPQTAHSNQILIRAHGRQPGLCFGVAIHGHATLHISDVQMFVNRVCMVFTVACDGRLRVGRNRRISPPPPLPTTRNAPWSMRLRSWMDD